MTPSYASIKEAVGQGEFYLKIPNLVATIFNLSDVNITAVCTYDDLYSNHSQCICGTYVIVNDARVWQVKVKFKDYSSHKKIGETEWEVADTYTTA